MQAPPPEPDAPAPPPLPVAPLAVPGFAQSLALCALFYGMAVAVAVPLELAKKSGGPSLDMFTALLLQQLVAWPVTLWVAHRWAKATFAVGCPLPHFPVRRVPVLVLAALGLTILLLALAATIPMPDAIRKALGQGKGQSNPYAFFFAVVVIAPVAEEWFFRGLLLRGYLARYSPTKAIWVSALLFGAFHANPWQFVVAVPLGAWCAWLVVRSGSLLPGILVHVTANFSTNFVLPSLARAMGYTDAEIAKQTNLPLPLIGLGLGLVAIFGWLHARQFQAETNPPVPPSPPGH